MARSRFLQTLSEGTLRETRDGGLAREIKRDYIVRGGSFDRVRDAIGVVLKWTTRIVFGSPLLVLVRFLLRAMTGKRAEGFVVVFVAIVCAFFVVLSLYIIAAFIAWYAHARAVLGRPKKQADLHATLGPSTNDADTADNGRVVRVVGRAVALDSSTNLVSDFWTPKLRATEASVFAIVPKKGMPAIVMATTAPELRVDAQTAAALTVLASDWKSARFDARTLGESAVVRAGDEVEVYAYLLDRIPNVTQFELDGEMYRLSADAHEEDSPYREALRVGGLLLSDTRDVPLAIRVLSRAR